LENRGATTSDVETVNRYQAAGQKFTEFSSPVITLDSVLSKYKTGEVHILKIDVEGQERDVLLGANLEHHQPWIVVVESTRPNSQEDSSFEWEFLVLNSGYKLVLFDGLNKFYVRQDLTEVQNLLSVPANVFDEWESFKVNSAVEYAVSLRTTLEVRDIEISNAKNEIAELNVYIKALLESIERIEK
jgi:hypothetical protein